IEKDTTMRNNERGVALVMTNFLMDALSALAVSLMFRSQTETSSSRNYRTMSQARYAGEAGIHKAINYLLNTYISPSTYTSYDLTKSPVTVLAGCTHTTTTTCDSTSVTTAIATGCVVLSGLTGSSSNYPDAADASAFSTASQGTLAVNSAGTTTNAALGTVTYGAAAILLSMRSVAVYGGGTGVVQTWKIVADGTVPGAVPATVEVTATLERNVVAAQTYAIFATGTGCGAITMAGNEVTDSYNSTSMTMSGGHPVTTAASGAVGTNGNLNISGNVDIHGALSTPRTGVGACANGNITAETTSGNANVDGGMISLPQAKTYPTPSTPSPVPPTTALSITSSTSCATLIAALVMPLGATCSGTSGNLTITTNGATLSWGNVALSGGAAVTLAGGTSSSVSFNVNTFSMAGNSSIAITSGSSVTMNVAGAGVASGGTVLDFTGGSFSNSS